MEFLMEFLSEFLVEFLYEFLSEFLNEIPSRIPNGIPSEIPIGFSKDSWTLLQKKNNIFLVLGIILTIKYLATYPGFGACGVGFSASCGLRDRASDIGAFRITGSLSVQINTI